MSGVLRVRDHLQAGLCLWQPDDLRRLGLTLQAACAANDDISVTATTSKQNSSIYTSVADTDSAILNQNDDEESSGFDVGENFNLLATQDGDPDLVTFEYDSNDGSSVSGVLAVDENNDIGDDCQAHGHVLSS